MKSPKVQNNNLDSSWNESDFVPDVVATNDDDNVDGFFGNINRRSIQPHHPSMMMGGRRRRRRTSSSQQQYRLLPSVTHASRTALLEIPLRYDNGTLVLTQTNRMAISSVQPLLLPPLAYYFFGQQQEQQPQQNWLLRLHAATAMRGKTGFSTVQTGVQYNFATTTTMATPTTFTAGVILGEQAPVVYLGGGGRSCLVMSSSFQRHNVSAQVKIPTTQPQKTQVSWNSRHAILINRNAPYSSSSSSSNHTLDLLTSCCISPMNFFISSRNISKINNNTAMLQINLVSHQTQHAWNVGLGWNLFQARRSNSNSSSSLSRSNSSRSSYYPTLSFQFAPRLSLWHRHVSFRVSTNGRWDGDGTITTTTTISTATAKQQQSSTSTHTTTTPNNKQPTKPVTKFSVSVHRILQPSSGGLLVWTFSLTQGDFTLRIPVTIATTTTAATAAAAATAVKDTAAVAWWYTNPSWQFVYISMLSHILHDMLADILQLNVSNNTASTTAATTAQQQQQKEQWLLARDKARHEAILQQQFMAKQAKIRTDAEREIEGLVITRAVYAYYNKNPDDKIAESSSLSSSIISSLDVTIPLQFWVTDSSLHLPPALSKANMLGFYNVAASVPTSAAATTTTKESSTLPESSSSPWSSSWSSSTFLWNNPFVKWLSGLWTFRSSTTTAINHEDSVHRRNVQLTVQYDYAGRSYEITVSDQDELYLPNPLARLVGRHPEPVAE